MSEGERQRCRRRGHILWSLHSVMAHLGFRLHGEEDVQVGEGRGAPDNEDEGIIGRELW